MKGGSQSNAKGHDHETTCTRNLTFTAALACMVMAVGAAQQAPAQQKTTTAAQEKPAAQAQNPVSDVESADKLRKEAQNPIASLISVPIQENWNFGIDPGYRTQNVLNIQPVIPVDVGKDWNLIIRWITPVIYQPVVVPQESGPRVQTGYYGLRDMQPAFFFSPKEEQSDLGRRATIASAHGNQDRHPWARKIRIRPNRRGLATAAQMDVWVSCE
jgi:hypothetical protein